MISKWFDKMFIKANTIIRSTIEEERGDTNFISILIILGIVIILAGIFIGFKDTIVGQVQDIIDNFTIH